VLAWLHRMKRGFARRRVIVLTAMAQKDLTNLSDERVFAVIRKPFDVDELRNTVQRCVEGDEAND
jgi:DNA-binding NtrC family response regulator